MTTATTVAGRIWARTPRGLVPVHNLLLVAAVALPLALATLFAWTSWRGAWQEAEGEMRRDAVAVAEYSGRLLDGYRQTAERVGTLVRGLSEAEIEDRRPVLEQGLAGILGALPDVELIEVTARDGRLVLASTAGADRMRPALAAGLGGAAPGAVLLAPVPAQHGAPRTFAFALALDPAGGAWLICLQIRTGELAARLGRMVTGPVDIASLLHEDGRLLSRAPQPGLPPPTPQAAHDSPVTQALRAGLDRWYGRAASPHDGVQRLVAFSRVPGFPTYAVVARPASAIVAGWRREAAVPVVLGFASALLLAALGLLVWRSQWAMQHANQRLEVRVAERTVEVAQALAAQRAGAERLRLAIEAAGLASWEIDLTNGTVTRSDMLVVHTPLLPPTGFSFDAYLAQIHPEDRARLQQAFEQVASGALTSHRMDYRLWQPDGSWVWLESYGGVIDRDSATGRPTRIAGVSRNVTDRYQAEARLRASDARLRVALDAARFGTWEYDVRGGRGTRSGHLAQTLPSPPRDDFTFSDWLAELHPEDHATAERSFADLIADRTESFLVELRVRRAGGGWAIIESAGAIAERDPTSGAVLSIAGVARDVTEARVAAERQALLAREVDHRAKNALAVVQAALRLTPKTDAATYARAVEGRVRALARAHTLLAETQWQGAPLDVLAAAELAAFLPTGFEGASSGLARALLDGPSVTLLPAAAQGLSMALHELATNATKYGALSDPGGQVSLSWTIDAAAQLLRLRWEERGGPVVTKEPERRGFGSRVVEATVRDQLGGALTRQWNPSGLVCRIDLPLSRAVGGGDALAPRLRAAE